MKQTIYEAVRKSSQLYRTIIDRGCAARPPADLTSKSESFDDILNFFEKGDLS